MLPTQFWGNKGTKKYHVIYSLNTFHSVIWFEIYYYIYIYIYSVKDEAFRSPPYRKNALFVLWYCPYFCIRTNVQDFFHKCMALLIRDGQMPKYLLFFYFSPPGHIASLFSGAGVISGTPHTWLYEIRIYLHRSALRALTAGRFKPTRPPTVVGKVFLVISSESGL